MELDSRSILGDEGRIAQRLSQYESRPQQLEMAAAVERAIAWLDRAAPVNQLAKVRKPGPV